MFHILFFFFAKHELYEHLNFETSKYECSPDSHNKSPHTSYQCQRLIPGMTKIGSWFPSLYCLQSRGLPKKITSVFYQIKVQISHVYCLSTALIFSVVQERSIQKIAKGGNCLERKIWSAEPSPFPSWQMPLKISIFNPSPRKRQFSSNYQNPQFLLLLVLPSG